MKKKLKEINNESKLIAIDELRKIVRRDPTNFDARVRLAELLTEKKSYLPAVKEYLILLDRKTNFEEKEENKYLNEIGKIYLELENFDEAKKYFLISKSKDEYNIDSNIKLAEVEMKLKNYDKAVYYYDIVDKLQPDNLEILKSHAICNFEMNKYNLAANKLLKIFKEKKDDLDEEVLYYLGYSFYNMNRFDEALKFFIKLKTIPKYAAESFLILGKIHKEQKLFVKSIEDFENAIVSGTIKDTETLCELHYLLADCYFQTHNLQKSMTHWRKTADLNPNYRDIQTKIENYSQISKNQLLEMYLVGSVNQFTKICKLFVKYYIFRHSSLKGNIKFLEMKTSSDGSLQILAEVTSGNFLELNYFVFMRSATTVGDMAMRNLYNRLKEEKADKGICITAGSFSVSAKEFVESRMLKIIERDELMDILNNISQKLRSK